MIWRRARPSDLPLALLGGLGATFAVLAAPALHLVAGLAPSCALHTLTGIPCFACGSTRAALALAKGDWLAALSLNPLAAFAIVASLGVGFAAPAWILLGGPIPGLGKSQLPWRVAAWAAFVLQWSYLILARR